ncbi:hypothetical protein FB45DRAFT_209729 [Roridomyces roridus]|uniref:F-box domain-containing protein n=1 Tax=Roridomyces roridus TaxID=1738132 RepID=A0AAD7CG35_9AGAR|nr:hypothetical protein FB45DRAFT_209729 [Roridomyces roridus]
MPDTYILRFPPNIPRLTDLPKCTLLQVMRHLGTSDIVRLLQTCVYIHSLSQDRSLWVPLLETTRARYPVGCPKHADLAQYTVQTLKNLIVSRFKLEKIWKLPSPKIVGHRVTSLHEGVQVHTIIGLVQGTDIALFCVETGHVVCWDSKLAAPFPFPPIKTGRQLKEYSEPSESTHGVCSFVVISRDDHGTVWRYIIAVTHVNRKATRFESVRTEIQEPIYRFRSLFLTKDVVGAVTVKEGADHCAITTSKVGAGARSAKESISRMKLNQRISKRHLLVAFTYKGHLYNILENGATAQIQHISRKAFTSGRCEEPTDVFKVDIPNLGKMSNGEPYYMLPTCASCGVAAAFVRQVSVVRQVRGVRQVRDATMFTFLPTTPVSSPTGDDGVSSPLAFPLSCATEHVPGHPLSSNLICMDHGGLNIVAVLENHPPKLVLVRYHPETQSTSTHHPDVAPSLDLDGLINVCVDDTAGIIFLTALRESKRSFFTLRYA